MMKQTKGPVQVKFCNIGKLFVKSEIQKKN